MQFRGPEHALRWAYETSSRPIVKLSSVNSMRGGGGAVYDELTQQDKHAQAALIISMGERIEDQACREYIAARFGGMTKPEEVTAIMNMIFQSLGTGIHGRRDAYKLLLCYFGANIGYRVIRYDLKCRDATVIEIRRNVYDALDVIGNRAMAEIAGELEVQGVIENHVTCAY